MSVPSDRDPVEARLRTWLAEEGVVSEPRDLLERVAGATRRVRQRPGWLVRLLGNDLGGAEAGPAARWRGHRMATALGLGTIAIVTALGIGSLGPGLLPGGTPAGVLDAPSPSASPSASPEYMVEVTGTFTREDVASYGSTILSDGIYHTRGPWWNITWEASDPRLSATGTYTSNWNEVDANGLAYSASAYVLVNADGRWAGASQTFGSLESKR